MFDHMFEVETASHRRFGPVVAIVRGRIGGIAYLCHFRGSSNSRRCHERAPSFLPFLLVSQQSKLVNEKLKMTCLNLEEDQVYQDLVECCWYVKGGLSYDIRVQLGLRTVDGGVLLLLAPGADAACSHNAW